MTADSMALRCVNSNNMLDIPSDAASLVGSAFTGFSKYNNSQFEQFKSLYQSAEGHTC